MNGYDTDPAALPPPRTVTPEIVRPRQRFSGVDHDLHFYWRMVYGQRWLLLGATLLGLSIAAVVTFRQPRLYVTQATVEFKEALPPGKVADIRGLDLYIAPALATRLLTTKVLAARVINGERGKGTSWASPPPPAPQTPSLLSPLWDGLRGVKTAVVDRFRLMFGVRPDEKKTEDPNQQWEGVDAASIGRYYRSIAIQPVRGTSLADVVVTHTDPNVAAAIANAHTQGFIDMDIETKVASLQDAQSLLGGQLKQVRGQLEASRKALTDYQMEHGIVGLPKNNSTITKESLKQLNKLLTETQGQRIIAEAAYRNAAAQSADELANTLNDDSLQALRTELLAHSARYQANLQDYGPNHPDMVAARARVEALRNRLKTAAVQVRERLEANYKAFQAKENDLRENLESLAHASSQEDRQLVQLSILDRDVKSNEQLYNNLLQQVKEADLNSGAYRWANVRLVDRATVPGAPSFPKTQRNLGMGLFLGFAIGAFGCVLLERLDNRIHTPDEVAAALDLPTFAVVPNFRTLSAAHAYGYGANPAEKVNGNGTANGTGAAVDSANGTANGKGNGHNIIPVLHPTSLVSEAYRTLRTNLLFSSPERPPQTVLVSSTEAGEGKTLTIVNLAVSLALSGARVVLVDADVRRPKCHKTLNVPRHPGLTDVLAGQCDLAKALTRSPLFGEGGYRLPNDHGFHVLPAGTTAPNPAELLGSRAMDNVLSTLKEQFEFVLVDSPPILRVTDGVVLATKTDGVLFVIKGGEWSHDIIQRAVSQLDNVRANTLGVVLNCVDPKRGGSSYYYYRHYHKSYYHSSGYGDGYGATHDAEDEASA